MPQVEPPARFVVLEHIWNDTHLDLMLEFGPALATWVLPVERNPRVATTIWRIADHRLAYLDYEGPLSGNRGRVRRIERGTYQAKLWEPNRVSVVLCGQRPEWTGLFELVENQAWVGPNTGTVPRGAPWLLLAQRANRNIRP